MWHHFRQAFRGQCDSSNRVLAIATACVKNSSYPSILSVIVGMAHSTGSITAARGYRGPGICVLHTPKNAIHDPIIMKARPSTTLSISMHVSTSPVIRVLIQSLYAGNSANFKIEVYALVPKTLNLFTPPSGMIVIFI